ncbi:hypothetical protein N6H18_16430 [Reichenbachiella agarivorans]|uniref:Oxygen tolerance n=1 Tax=Reichenbachiella agarivorans TaxID=2979464 RepID=A0ABY6CRE6_9BACT|nr:hypothetical protein [Reichenbachiella agarivorans]UXP31933.1 hypothetical protein N6H18_16430 [Reichenbachiella agarivorans]
MRPNGKFYLIWVWLAIVALTTDLQAQRLWSQVHLNRSATYVGQPVEVSITVYTSTWFTSGLDLGNIQIDGAYTIYFRPVSVSMYVDGVNYPGIQLIYHVFPYQEEDIVFPSLTLEVETPPDGDFKGVKHHLKTQEKVIKVRPAPPGFDKTDWLVATGMYVSDHWSGSLKQVKVGDVLERKIARTVYGTVAELIPPIGWDSTASVSMYPDRSITHNEKGKTSISSSRTEGMRYLFEKEGTVTLPEMVFTYFHPYRKKLYKRTLKSITIEVQPNPDLGVLKSVRDSLLVQQQTVEATAQEDQPWRFMGLSAKQLATISVLSLLMLYILIKVLRYLIAAFRQHRQNYRASEAYFFDLYKKASHHNKANQSEQALYRWIDELKLEQPTLRYFVDNFGTDALRQAFSNRETVSSLCLHTKEWKSARKNYLQSQNQLGFQSQPGWINP